MAPTDIRTALAEQRKRQARGSWWSMLKQTASEWLEDDAMTWAAAVACYVLMALAPLLVIAIKVVTVFRGGQAAGKLVSTQAANWMGPATSQAIAEILKRTAEQRGGLLASIISAVLVVVSVGGVFAEFQQATNRMWKLKPKPGQALWGFIRARLKSVLVMSIAAFLLLASVAVATWLENVTKSIGLGWKYVTWVIDVLVSIGVLTLLFAMLYRTVPDAQIAWKSTWMGAAISAVLFEVGKYALAAYFKFATPTSAFGAVGSLAAILIWIYYSAQIVFFGAEFTQVYAKARGQGVRPSRHAEFLSECDETETATPSQSPPYAKPPRPTAPRPIAPQQYAAVLAPHAPMVRWPQPAGAPQVAPGVRAYLAAGAGLIVGALIGGYGALQAQPKARRPSARESAAARLNERMRRVEQKVGRVSRIKRLLEQENVNDRIDALERQVRRAGQKLRSHQRARRWQSLI